MARLWPVLLLVLALWPTPAAASSGVPFGEADEIQAQNIDYGSGALRAPNPLVLAFGVEAHRCGGCSHRSHGGGGPVPQGVGGSALLLAHARLLVGPGSTDPDDVGTPLCEHLPYHATAPPSPR